MSQSQEPGLENLLDRLRRQTTMSPLQQSMLGGQQQQPQQQPQQQQYPQPQQQQQQQQHHHQQFSQPDAYNYPQHQQSPFQQQFQTDSPVYSPMHPPPQNQSIPGFASTPDNANAYPAYGQAVHSQAQDQPPQQFPSTQAPMTSAGNQSYASPMSPSHDNPNENRTASLLQLLKFSKAVPSSSSPAPAQSTTPQQHQGQTSATAPPPRPFITSPPPPPVADSGSPPAHNRAISAQDLVNSLFSRQSADGQKENTAPAARTGPAQQRTAPDSEPAREKSPVNPQDLVFQLLGRPKPATGESSSLNGDQQSGQSPPFERRTTEAKENTSDAPPNPVRSSSSSSLPPMRSSQPDGNNPSGNKGMFSYVNPFEQLSATSPRNRTPKPGATGRKSALGLNEMRAENIPLPYTPSPGLSSPTSPHAPIEAEASKEATTLGEVKSKEKMLMDQLNSQIAEQYPAQEYSAPSVNIYEDHEEPTEPEQQQEAVEPAPEDQEYENIENIEPETNGTHKVRDIEVREGPPTHEEEVYDEPINDELIEVYNFPMKPFVSITIVPSAIRRPKYPESKFADIARMARTFDQLDRNLISASHGFIAYAMSKSGNRGGIRVIRQHDGQDRVLMKDSLDRTFNVTIGRGERVLGTGVSGAVVWVGLLEDFEIDGWPSMFVFPPSEEQGQSNGVLKSRARKTSRHQDVFAIGRGRTISLVYAPAAKAYSEGRKGNEVDSRKYLADHGRVIDTGKASKDFAFSDDDTVIISIDKAGKLKFWDVRPQLDFDIEAYNVVSKSFPPQVPQTLTTPALIFSAVAAGESYRATSVMFLDKYRPYLKCLALRYVIVGMKQNHTLQLWDLALGRPVQEINFPQESDTDALCSVAYHPSSGIIVVGNPTRNSIYFIHLSAPKYNLPTLSQAQYIEGLANKDASIPKPDATAILSGLREYSFADKGQLMSVDILDTEGEHTNADEAQSALFELYVAHSKGMTTMHVYKEDLGWFADNKVKNPVDAVEKGACTLSNMPPPPPQQQVEREEKVEAPAESAPSSLKPKAEKSGNSRSVSPAARQERSETGDDRSVASGSSKKKKKEKAVTLPPAVEEEKPATNGKAKASNESSARAGAIDFDEEVKKIEKAVSEAFSNVLGSELDQLYRKFDDDRRVQQAAGDAKQDAILRLLSTTLTENVEQVITRIVVNNIQSQVVPAIANVTADSVDKALSEVLARNLSVSLPNELRKIVPEAIARALGHPELLNHISDQLVQPLAQSVQREFSLTLQNSIVPSFQRLALDAAQQTVLDVERKQAETINKLEHIHRQDSQKIDTLMQQIQHLTEAVTAIGKAQADFQEQTLQAQEEFYRQTQTQTPATQPEAVRPPPVQKTPNQIEAEEIENLLQNQRYEDGTIKWLQSKERQAELFDEVMVRYRYDFLPNLSQLVLLSVSAAVSVKFDHKVMERLSWLEGVLAVLDPLDPEIHEICQRIMGVVVQRLEQLYMSVSVQDHGNPVLRKIPAIARRAKELSQASAGAM